MCGFANVTTLSSTPKCTMSLSTVSLNKLRLRVFNFPSLNAPAPPSPNSTLLNALNLRSTKKRRMSRNRSSTCFPCSYISTEKPLRRRCNAAQSPLGPAPMMSTWLGIGTVLLPDSASSERISLLDSMSPRALFPVARTFRFKSKTTLYDQRKSPLRLESSEKRSTSKLKISSGWIRSVLASAERTSPFLSRAIASSL